MSENDNKKIMLSSNWEGVLLVAASAAGFSTLAILGKLAYASGLNLPSLLAFRFLGASVILWVWLLLRDSSGSFHYRWPVTFAQAIRATLLGAIGFAIEATLFFSALLYADAGVVTLLLYTYPAFVTLFAWLIEGEIPNSYRKMALAVALVGCLLAADLSQATVAPLGILFGLASGLWYAAYLMFGARLVKTLEPVVTSAYVSLGSAFSFGMITLITHQLTLPDSVESFSAVVGIAVMATALPFVALFSGIQKIGATKASIVSTIEPVMTVLLGILFLGERLEDTQVLGGLMVVISVVLANLGGRSEQLL